MLPLLYQSKSIAQQIIEDPQTAPIPELHKAMFRWVEKFTRRSWEMTEADLQELRGLGLSDEHAVDWAHVACLQTWWVMSADGGGIPLEKGAVTGVAVCHTRQWYESAAEGLLAASPGSDLVERPATASLCWIKTDESAAGYRQAAAWARERYGFVPNLLRALTLGPDILPRHQYALELLERPQSRSLSPLRHAMVRALVSSLNRCAYSFTTTRQLLFDAGGDHALLDRVAGDYRSCEWNKGDRAVLDFADKVVRNTYKVTAADAQSLREAGLDDDAYVDVLNTVSIQTSLDRLANALGVTPDERAVRPLGAAG